MPQLKGIPIELKKTGNSIFWVHAEDVQDCNAITVVKQDCSAGYWTGTIRVLPKGIKATVSYNAGIPPASMCMPHSISVPTGTAVPPVASASAVGDIIDVDITITATGGPAIIEGVDAIVDPS